MKKFAKVSGFEKVDAQHAQRQRCTALTHYYNKLDNNPTVMVDEISLFHNFGQMVIHQLFSLAYSGCEAAQAIGYKLGLFDSTTWNALSYPGAFKELEPKFLYDAGYQLSADAYAKPDRKTHVDSTALYTEYGKRLIQVSHSFFESKSQTDLSIPTAVLENLLGLFSTSYHLDLSSETDGTAEALENAILRWDPFTRVRDFSPVGSWKGMGTPLRFNALGMRTRHVADYEAVAAYTTHSRNDHRGLLLHSKLHSILLPFGVLEDLPPGYYGHFSLLTMSQFSGISCTRKLVVIHPHALPPASTETPSPLIIDLLQGKSFDEYSIYYVEADRGQNLAYYIPTRRHYLQSADTSGPANGWLNRFGSRFFELTGLIQ